MRRCGTCEKQAFETGVMFILPDYSALRKEVEKTRLSLIIDARMEETLKLLKSHLEKEGLLENLTAGIVISGGGALLDSVDHLAEKVFDMPVRIGAPTGVVGISHGFSDCRFATGIGLVLYASRNSGRELSFSRNGKSRLQGVTGKVKSFFNDFI